METTNSETPVKDDGKAIESPPVWWVATQIAALASHVPLSVLAGGVGATMDLGVSLLISLVISAIAILLYVALKVTLGRPWQSLMITSALLIGFWHWSASANSNTLLRLVWVALLVAAAARFASSRRFRTAILALSVTLAVTPVLLVLVKSYGAQTEITSRFDGFPGDPETKPDIYFLLLDGYGNSDVLRDIYGFDNEPFLSDLERKGFDVSRSATADYTFTYASVASILNMEYLDGPEQTNSATLGYLTDVIAGDNRVVSWLKDLGYMYIHGETYDGTNDCGPSVDVCLPSPLWDYTTEYLLDRTPVGPLIFPVSGSPVTQFNLTRIEQMSGWMRNWGAEAAAPKFVFIHLLLPHPPYFLNANCEVRLASDLGGQISERDLSAEVVAARRAGYVEQVQCANRVATQFVEQIDPYSVIILAADHGPESLGQLTIDGSQWTDTELFERAGVLAAIRGSVGCQLDLPDDHHLVNTFRIALSCLTSSPLPSLPHLGTS